MNDSFVSDWQTNKFSKKLPLLFYLSRTEEWLKEPKKVMKNSVKKQIILHIMLSKKFWDLFRTEKGAKFVVFSGPDSRIQLTSENTHSSIVNKGSNVLVIFKRYVGEIWIRSAVKPISSNLVGVACYSKNQKRAELITFESLERAGGLSGLRAWDKITLMRCVVKEGRSFLMDPEADWCDLLRWSLDTLEHEILSTSVHEAMLSHIECVTDLDYEERWLFLSRFRPLLKRASFFEAAGAVAKIGSSLKLNHHLQF